jgi:hypothetical protein
MQHLSLEDLARLVDEPPEPDEAAHLRGCLVCRREMEEMRAQTEDLAGLADPEPSPGAWRALEERLAAEGLVRGPARVTAMPRRVWLHPALRVAAAAALFLLGAGAGAGYWARHARGDGTQPLANAPTAGARPSPDGAADSQPGTTVLPPGGGTAGEDADGLPANGARFTSSGDTGGAGTPKRSPEAEAAARELARARADYEAALRRYAELADPSSGADPVTRLDALNGLVATTRTALDRAPGDPVTNGYHLAAVEERDALIRQMRQNESTWF